MKALPLLRALVAALPDINVHLRLSDDGEQLIVGLCERVDLDPPKFYDAALDPPDHDRAPEDVAADVAALYHAHAGAEGGR